MSTAKIIPARLPAAPDGYDRSHMNALIDVLERQLDAMRRTINYLVENPTVASPGTPTSSFAEGLWGFDPRPAGNPDGMLFTTSSNPIGAVWVRVWRMDRRNYDMWGILSTRAVGTKMYIQTKSDSTNYVNYTLSGAPTLSGDVINIPVTYAGEYGGSVASAAWQECFIHFSAP